MDDRRIKHFLPTPNGRAAKVLDNLYSIPHPVNIGHIEAGSHSIPPFEVHRVFMPQLIQHTIAIVTDRM